MRWIGLLFALALGAPALAENVFVQLEGSSDAIGADGRLSQAVGIQVNGDEFMKILPRGCKLPCARPYQFNAKDAGQTKIGFRVFRGNTSVVKHAQALGLVRVSGYPVSPHRASHVVVVFTADNSGIRLSAADGLVFEQVAP